MKKSLIDKLNKRKHEGTNRSLLCLDEHVDFWSNDYLGIAKKDYSSGLVDVKYGATGSRLISGNSQRYIEIEAEMAKYYSAKSAICFNSGYDANLGFFSCIPEKNDLVLYDEHIHASIRDGIRLGIAKGLKFKHNDFVDLKVKIDKYRNEFDCIYISIESIYSMHGDLAPIHEIIKLTDNQKVFLVVDEAHAGGVLGSLGKGLSFQYADKILARLVTFGKAYGTHGAIILGSEYLKDYLINFSRPLIYTTALPVKNWVRINAVIHDDLAQERNKLFDNIAYFRQTASQINYFSDPLSPIQTIRFQSREHLLKAQDAVRDSGFAVKAILTPTVPIGDECLRISIHSFNLKEEIDRLIEVLKHFC